MLAFKLNGDDGPVLTGGANFYGGPVNQPIGSAPTGLTGDSVPSIPGVTPILPPPEVLLYGPGPNIAPPVPQGTQPAATPASSPCGGCSKATPASSPAPSTMNVRLATSDTGAPAPETAAQAAAPFPWWWLLAAAVVGYAARGRKRGR